MDQSRPLAPAQSAAPALRRVLRHRGGNTLAIMAAAMIPMSALAGSAVDMARLYVVKSRLQQACDAGVLAGRKFMTAGTSTTLDATATTRAKAFFANNFTSGWLDTGTAAFTPSKTTDQQVYATASVKVPMTIMRMFASPDVTVKVDCKARYDVADTDIVFVLDTTGSMACRPEDDDTTCSNYVNAAGTNAYTRPSGDSDATAGYQGTTSFAVPETTSGNGSRIKALRQAVKDFYSVIASTIDTNTRVRYGFVTYSSIVNAGKAIYSVDPSYFDGYASGTTVDYETRVVTADYKISTARSGNGKTQANCASTNPVRSPATALTYNTASGTATQTYQAWDGDAKACYNYTDTLGPEWTYKQANLPVSAFLTGASVTDPTHVDGETSRWDGCIEERQTEAGTTSFTSASYDLDPALIPSSKATRWRPAWADAEWSRWGFASTANQTTDGDDMPSHYPPSNLGSDARRKQGYYACGKPIHRLSTMTAAQVAAYVDAADFKPLGGTYHDVGMIWGLRLLAGKGIFAADNAGRANQPTPKKVIVFLTDGDMSPSLTSYGFYGMEYYDRRVSGGTFSKLTDYHNARFLYECQKAADLGVDVWTIAIDTGTTTQLTQCASNSSQALFTNTGSGLSTIFQQIAKQVAMLRIET